MRRSAAHTRRGRGAPAVAPLYLSRSCQILVVSGPTVVGPLLKFVRPTDRVQWILVRERSLIDPVGGILGAPPQDAVRPPKVADGVTGPREGDLEVLRGVDGASWLVRLQRLQVRRTARRPARRA